MMEPYRPPRPRRRGRADAWRKSLAALLLAGAGFGAAAQASPPPSQQLRIVGGLAGVNQFVQHEQPFWTRTLPEISNGRYSAAIVPFDRAGIPAQDMVRLMQMGVIPFGTIPLSRVAPQEAVFSAADLAGLNPDIATLKTTLAAFRPYLENTLRQRYGIELLAIYTYPAQMVFCNRPITRLEDLAGRRVRVSGTTLGDFVRAFGAIPVVTVMNDLLPQIRKGNVSCAITGTMTGNTLGLHEVTTHIYAMPITWGLSMFGANLDSWIALEPELRVALRDALPRLEARIWAASEQATLDGLACNTGAAGCRLGRKGSMTAVPMDPRDQQRLRDIVQSHILPSWLRRCGPECATIWNQTIAPVRGITAPGAS